MKRFFKIPLLIGLLFLTFLFISVKINYSYAQVYTCTNYSGQYCSPEPCSPDPVGTGTCRTPYNCCKAPIYTCELTENQACTSAPGMPCDAAGYHYGTGTGTCANGGICCKTQAPEPSCIRHNASGCNITGDCCTTEGTTCSTANTCICPYGDTWNAATNKCVHYTCADTNLQYCSPEPCDRDTEVAGTGTCGPNRNCCKSTDPDTSDTGEVTTCPLCPTAYTYEPLSKRCVMRGEGQFYYQDVTIELCQPGHLCYPGCGCDNHGCAVSTNFTSRNLPCSADGTCETAIGTISTNPASNNYLVKAIFRVSLSLVGGLAVLLIILSGFRLISSQGNPEKIQGAREQLLAAIIGLLFVIFAYSILSFIGVDLLRIFPG